MKKINFVIFASIAIIGFSCSGSSSSSDTSNKNNAVCVWDNISLKESPDEAGKWLCSVSIGETTTYLKETKEDNSGKKAVEYILVKLKDGKEGWVQSDFVIVDSKAAAILEDSEIYSRPDLLNKTGKFFSKMDIVAVKSTKDGFIEVVGKRKDGKWLESGWLKEKSVTYSDIDVAVAKFARKALEISDVQKRNEALKELVNNSDFSSSSFISSLLPQEQEVAVELSSDTTKTE
ncbi:MAG TPA: hypothetical protein DIW31_08165 [Bacteroidales bacterium]|nr:hypothetical protein [Bacteroidales bacterium]